MKYNFKHGLCKSPEYEAWRSMLNRCRNKKMKCYHNYGGRGISVHERWHKFENFLSDIGKRPDASYSLDRIDNDGNYEPGNCRWTTREVQLSNTRKNVWVEHAGMKMTLAGWARYFGVDRAKFNRSIKKHSFEYMYEFYNKTKTNGVTN